MAHSTQPGGLGAGYGGEMPEYRNIYRCWENGYVGAVQKSWAEGVMKIATMATGGIGGFLAVKLALSGHQVLHAL